MKTAFLRRYALKCVRKRDVVEKNVQDALVSELSILKEAGFFVFNLGYDPLILASQMVKCPGSQVDHPFIIKFVRSFRNEPRP